ncbi:MAG: hypothetical protein Q8P05_02855 [Candidatus Diapherotrites archaeon]|nr:hypothetical protein [Candidatus Diapherotrites archaeon]MDZ4256004.1 hypothetical protein [archaeon]
MTPVQSGQVSMEVLSSILFLLMLFVVALLLIEQNKQSSARLQQNVGEEEVCIQLSSIITYMSSNPPYTETKFELLQDANITNNFVLVGDALCPVLGSVSNVQLYRGIVKAFDLNGTVIFTNDTNYNPFTPPNDPSGGGDVSNGIFLLIDDQNQTWRVEVGADDALYAISDDNPNENPDWVEFRFNNLGLTSANIINSVFVHIKHFESYHVGLNGPQNMVQCWDNTQWVDIEPYTPYFSETYYSSPDLSWCITDYNQANNARIRMTYEPAGVGQTISIDYGFIDVNFTQQGYLIDLWEHGNDLPQPLDFSTDVNSVANTFGIDFNIGNDGWDWDKLTYGGTIPAGVQFNADPNYDKNTSDSQVPLTQSLDLRMGGPGIVPNSPINPDDNATIGMVTSGAFGIQFDVNADMYSLLTAGKKLRFSFLYSIDPDPTGSNALDNGEESWVKLRFHDQNTITFLGSDLDIGAVDADPTPEIWFKENPSADTRFHVQNLTSLVTGPGTYYIDLGGGLGDWDTPREGVIISFDNLNLVVI